jgi:DNA-binding CsgD family transcriptional regulator
MATQTASNGRKGLSARRAEPTAEELVRLLVSQVGTPGPDRSAVLLGTDSSYSEEILIDLDLDGARYLLVRLPKASRARVQLSPREQEIVRMVAQGHPNKIIADVLSISAWTVCTHLRRIFAKLGVGSRAAMVARLLETGGWTEQMTHRSPVSACSSAASRNSPTITSQSSKKLTSDPRSELSAERVR